MSRVRIDATHMGVKGPHGLGQILCGPSNGLRVLAVYPNGG